MISSCYEHLGQDSLSELQKYLNTKIQLTLHSPSNIIFLDVDINLSSRLITTSNLETTSPVVMLITPKTPCHTAYPLGEFAFATPRIVWPPTPIDFSKPP